MSIQARIALNNDVWAMLSTVRHHLRAGQQFPESQHFEGIGTVGFTGPHIDEHEDDAGEYIRVGFTLPEGSYAEIDGDTYGTLNAFRVYAEVE